jgi:hypothetical protein
VGVEVEWAGELPDAWCVVRPFRPPATWGVACKVGWRRQTLCLASLELSLVLPLALPLVPTCMQWYHAIQRVEAFGSQLGAGDVARLRDWAARQQNPLPSPGTVPSYVAAALLEQQQQAGEGEGQQGQERQPAGEEMEEQSPGATASGRGEAGWQQAQQPAAAAAGIMRQQSLESTTSSLSFAG